MVNTKQPIFKYKTDKGHLHRMPAMLKFFLLLPLSMICISLPPLGLVVGKLSAGITAFLCKFTLREQLTDLKPVFYYAGLMYLLSVLSNLLENLTAFAMLEIDPAYFSPLTSQFSAFEVLIPRSETLQIILRLSLIVQLSALLFRSTSSMEIRDVFYSIEHFFRRLFSRLPFFGKRVSMHSRFAESISLFISFIPETFATWTSINLSWKARGGKLSVKNIKTLLFVLITLSFEKASLKAKALEIRNKK